MFAEVFGYRVSLIHLAVAVAVYDLVHILYEYKERFVRFQYFEDNEFGCLGDLYQTHCLAVYGELGIYTIDFAFSAFLIYGVSSVRQRFPRLLAVTEVKIDMFSS